LTAIEMDRVGPSGPALSFLVRRHQEVRTGRQFPQSRPRWECRPRRVFDHDFRPHSIGLAIPYGLYDITENRGAVVVGVSHDTAAFAAHAIAHWRQQEGSQRYSGSRQLLILADTGGSNGYRCYARKTELQSQLANSFDLAVTVAHYPTG